MTSRIQAYFHCKTCIQAGHSGKVAVGLADPDTMVVHCETCDTEMGKFTLANPMPMGTCACGQPLGGHTH